MVFVAGALAGLVVGLAAAALFPGVLFWRRAGRSSLIEGRGFATAVALLALLVAAVALANSNRRIDRVGRVASAAPTTSPTTTRDAASTTTATTAPGGFVRVPNVEHIARVQAVPILRHAGLRVSIQRLPISNVPAGFVISQDPLPAATAAAGSTVTLVVSAAP
jgi:hypothetical protein